MKSNNPLKEFSKLSAESKNVCFLHSGSGGKSILAYNPKAKYSGSSITGFKRFAKKYGRCLLIGYLSYDLAYQLYNIPQRATDDLRLPNIHFLAFEKWREFTTEPKSRKKFQSKTATKKFKSSTTRSNYKKAYQKIQKYIVEGDIYQVNLTHRLETKTNILPRELFLRLTKSNPVNFLAYIEGDVFEILSASPERFVKIKNGNIETQPIKGTRPRGRTPKEDTKLKKDLIESEKEAAELNMIIDLLRNDLGKICKVGTVKVNGHRLIKKCPSVWHTYSNVSGEITKPPIDCLLSMLPGGSITGCPKKRAIEIIDELEPTTRSIYTGVIGYIKPDQELDFSIAIRTVIKKDEKLYLQVGGGIVLDSDEKSEYKETLDKAKSFTNLW